jgi:hypothetical protein
LQVLDLILWNLALQFVAHFSLFREDLPALIAGLAPNRVVLAQASQR